MEKTAVETVLCQLKYRFETDENSNTAIYRKWKNRRKALKIKGKSNVENSVENVNNS